MVRCMGREENRRQCMNCKRLPTAADEEEAEAWLDHTLMTIPCMQQKPIRAIRARVLERT